VVSEVSKAGDFYLWPLFFKGRSKYYTQFNKYCIGHFEVITAILLLRSMYSDVKTVVKNYGDDSNFNCYYIGSIGINPIINYSSKYCNLFGSPI
jgi:hypothetical protein